MKHTYEQFRNTKDASERIFLETAESFQKGISFKVFKKTKEEKQILKKRMLSYPAKNHAPVATNIF